jgi:hypothetical protein
MRADSFAPYRSEKAWSIIMTDETTTTWYRADVPGLRPHDEATRTPLPGGNDYVYMTSRLDVARAFAAQRGNRSVYEVEPGGFIWPDPDYPEESNAASAMCDYARVVRVVDENVQMTAESARQFISQFFLWPDKSRMYDDDGYPTAPPEMRRVSRGAEELRPLGRYPKPDVVLKLIRDLLERG